MRWKMIEDTFCLKTFSKADQGATDHRKEDDKEIWDKWKISLFRLVESDGTDKRKVTPEKV